VDSNFDIIVIGSGPGGYVAAIRSAQLGYKTAIVEKYDNLGGTCTNVGCIPTKALLDSTEHFHNASSKFRIHGIVTSGLTLDFHQLIKRRGEVVNQNVSGLKFLMKKNKIEVFHGVASFLSSNKISIKRNDGTTQLLSSRYFIIATGSKPDTIKGVDIDKKRIITSTEALVLPEIPKSIVIIGGGVVGVEMASIYARIGVKVTIIEYLDSLVPTMDRELGKELRKVLQRIGITSRLGCKVQLATNIGTEVRINYLAEDNIPSELLADYCLVAVGRRPYTAGLNFHNTKIKTDPKGYIITNEQLQTADQNIYAIGDVVKGPMLAHKAEEDGVFAVETIDGQKPVLNYHLIPSVVYTWPEVAGVGFTEEQLKQENRTYHVGKFPFSASGRARAAMDSDGFTKVLTDPKCGAILGVHIIGARAADLIGQAVIGIHYKATDEDLTRISYAHPTYSETLKESYLIASGQGALNL